MKFHIHAPFYVFIVWRLGTGTRLHLFFTIKIRNISLIYYPFQFFWWNYFFCCYFQVFSLWNIFKVLKLRLFRRL